MIQTIAKRIYPRRSDYRRRKRFQEYVWALILTLALGLAFTLIALFSDLQH